MKFEWDENKRQTNLQRHQIDFADARQIFENERRTIVDDRFDYGETRIFHALLVKRSSHCRFAY